jgi:hypothetical protein
LLVQHQGRAAALFQHVNAMNAAQCLIQFNLKAVVLAQYGDASLRSANT